MDFETKDISTLDVEALHLGADQLTYLSGVAGVRFFRHRDDRFFTLVIDQGNHQLVLELSEDVN